MKGKNTFWLIVIVLSAIYLYRSWFTPDYEHPEVHPDPISYEEVENDKEERRVHSWSSYEPGEPLPEDVSDEDAPRYQWIMDQPGYNGDWSFWVEKYENETGDF